MAAAAFVATAKFKCADGYAFQMPFTVSDVNAAFYLGPDGQSFITLPSGHGVVQMWDIILSAAGTDTRTATITANSKATGETVQNSANLGTNTARQFIGAPVNFQPGANVRFTQVT
jgi:hypothetical protein